MGTEEKKKKWCVIPDSTLHIKWGGEHYTMREKSMR